MTSIFSILGNQLRTLRAQRHLTQPALAQRLGRDRARISELERDLTGERWGRDRLTLFAEMCDALDVVPILVPRARASEISGMTNGSTAAEPVRPVRSAFDDVFVDLGDEDEKRR